MKSNKLAPEKFSSSWNKFVRDNVNLHGSVDVADAVYLLAALFSGGPSPVPAVAGDVNADSATNVADVVYLLGHLFAGGLDPARIVPGSWL